MCRRVRRSSDARELRDVDVAEQHCAAGRFDEPQHRAPERRLAASRLADEPERFARKDVERHAVDRLHDAAAPEIEVDLQVSDGDQGGHRPRGRSDTASDGSGVSSTNGGKVSWQTPSARAQRGANGQPGPRCATSGGRPGIWYSSFRSSHVGSGTDASRPFVYGFPGRAKSASVGARSMTLPAYMTTTWSVVPATTPRSCVIEDDARAGFVLDSLDELENLRLDRHVERGRRLVGDEQLRPARQRHRDHHALAHAAGELVRIAVGAAPRVGDADHLEHVDRVLAGFGFRSARGAAASPPSAGGRSA